MDEDKVIQRIDVFLAKPEDLDFYLLQARTKPLASHEIHTKLKSAEFKKNANLLHLKYRLKRCIGPSFNQMHFDNEPAFDYIDHTCSGLATKHDLYCFGIYTDSCLFIIPLSGMLDSTPNLSFHHDEEQSKVNQNSDESTQLDLLRVENKELRKRRMRSYPYMQKIIAQEKWEPLEIIKNVCSFL
ncbi:hypothetical protein MXB_1101 [Myxobolus squamalis]|nr:hypothetical protein MXB_1101 [Myxobolus squamalis]